MIIKGGSRSGPEQLARHLQRLDTNEQVTILELQSLNSDLAEAFRDWQTLVEGTHGTKGLYHANIDPAEQYTLTTEQWLHAVEVLEKELGFEGQDRAVLLHKKYGREHLHVVWQRTDIDTMTLRSDSQNYQAHERASKALELEFGHEPVPGKHAKRDRKKQGEFPRAETDHAEWQQAERTGISAAERKNQVTALKQASDGAAAFKAALEDQGYIVAKGRRDFVLVDQMGNVYSLARQIRGIRTAELREFMKGINLPTVEQAKETQKEMLKQAEASAVTESAPDPVQAQSEAQRKDETEALRQAMADRHEEETRRLVETHKAELNLLRQTLDADTREKLDRLDATHKAQVEAQRLRLQQEQAPAGIFDVVQDFFSPARAVKREADIRREQDQLVARQKQERNEYAAVLQQTTELETGNMTERQALALHDHAIKGEEDLERYLREREAARQLQAELKEQERQREEELTRNGPDMKAPDAEALPTAEQAATEQAEKPAREQQRLTEEKKLLSPDQIQALQKAVVDRQPRDAADGPERQQDEFERTRKQQRIRFERKDRITALKQLPANAEAFRVALAAEGYVLAKGDRGALIVVDQTGAVFALARQIPGMSAAEFQEFMAGIDRSRLPSARQAMLMHRQDWKDKQQQERAEAAALERQSRKEAFRLSPEEMEALIKAVADRQTREAAEMGDLHKTEYLRTRRVLDDDIAERLVSCNHGS